MDRYLKALRTLMQCIFVLFLVVYTITSVSHAHVYAAEDTLPPTSNATLLGNWGGHYFTSSVEVTISAADNNEGVAYTAYRINSGTWTAYTEPFFVEHEGVYVIAYFSEDHAGNPEQAKTIQFEINFNAPTPTPTSIPLPTQITFATYTPTPTVIPTTAQGVTPTATPTKSASSTQQAYPASFPYYRSPTKTPTPTPSKVKTVTSNKPNAPPVALTAREIFSPTPSPQVMYESERPDNNEPSAVLGKWTRTDNDHPESSAPWHMLIIAVMTAGGYIFFVYYLYSKTSG